MSPDTDPRMDLWGEHGRPSRRRVLLDIGGAALFTAIALLPAGNQSTPLIVCAVLLGLAIAVRRLAWQAMVALAVVAGVLQIMAGQLALAADLAYAVVCYTLAVHPRANLRRFAPVAAGLAVVSCGVAVGVGQVDVGGGRSLFSTGASAALAAIVAGGGWVTGSLRWQSRRRISAQVQAGLEQERTRIAADMHDLVAHTWAVVAAQADGARYVLAQQPDAPVQVTGALELIADTARESIGDLRDLLAELRYEQPSSPPGLGRRATLLDRLRASGLDVEVTTQGERPAEADQRTMVGDRVLAEALTNALKHGDVDHPVEVEEDWRDGYRLAVRNRLAAGAPAAHGAGHGVIGMRDRVRQVGGELHAGSDDGWWVVRVRLPSAGPS